MLMVDRLCCINMGSCVDGVIYTEAKQKINTTHSMKCNNEKCSQIGLNSMYAITGI